MTKITNSIIFILILLNIININFGYKIFNFFNNSDNSKNETITLTSSISELVSQPTPIQNAIPITTTTTESVLLSITGNIQSNNTDKINNDEILTLLNNKNLNIEVNLTNIVKNDNSEEFYSAENCSCEKNKLKMNQTIKNNENELKTDLKIIDNKNNIVLNENLSTKNLNLNNNNNNNDNSDINTNKEILIISETTINPLIINTESSLTSHIITTTPLSTNTIQSYNEPTLIQSSDLTSFSNNIYNNFNYIQSFIESEKFIKINETLITATTPTTTTTTTTPIIEEITTTTSVPITPIIEDTTITPTPTTIQNNENEEFILPDTNIIDSLPVTTIQLNDGTYYGPKLFPNGCLPKFACRKKERLNNQRFCIKYILKQFNCNGEEISVSRKNWGRTIDIDKIISELEEDKNKTEDELDKKYGVSPVHMVDFPCQPNYLPDRRGICREIHKTF